MILLAAACGLKGNPVSQKTAEDLTQEESKLTAIVNNESVELTWSNAKEEDSHVNIERSELGSTGNVCRNCPRSYTRIAQLPLKTNSRFIDLSVEKGKSYSYRLGLCDKAGSCRQSLAVEIEFK
jgi:hypothetical protein